MGLKIPDLDDREYAEILEDARERIPIHAEEWTDHNVHDPGITILETLAWIAESYVYQLDQVTDNHRRKYLKLMGVRPEPPKPATASLRLELPQETGETEVTDLEVENGQIAGTTIPEGETLAVEDVSGQVAVFRTVSPVTLTEAGIQRIISEHRGGRTDNTNANATPEMYFLGFGEEAHPGSAMYLGFDADPFGNMGIFDIMLEFYETNLPDLAIHGKEPSEFEPSVSVSWEYCEEYSNWFRDVDDDGNKIWKEFAVRYDGTNRLYGSGTVRLERPTDWDGTPANKTDNVLDQEEELVWIRCRIGRPKEGKSRHEIPPQFDTIAVNTVRASHGMPVEEEKLKRPDGGTETTALPGQTFEFDHGSVIEGPSELDGPPELPEDNTVGSTGHDDFGERTRTRTNATVVIGPGDEQGVLDVHWEEVEDFDSSGPDDKHFVLDRGEGTIRFGDEVRGAIPKAGQRVLARSFVNGGGTEGNVPGTASWSFRRDEVRKEGVYTYYSGPYSSSAMKGAIVVGDSDDRNLSDWFNDARGDVETIDLRGEPQVTIAVGDEIEGELAFSPAVAQVDPGTLIRFVWHSDGHSVIVEDQPIDGGWTGHPIPETEGYEFRHTFEPSINLSQISVHPQGPAMGGRKTESIDEALDRLRADMAVSYRAVTLSDYGTIAESTPGLRFGRAKGFVDAGEDPTGCNRRPAVRVIVVPYSPHEKPVPSAGFLEAVKCHLERHRLLTDRVEVDPPTYVGIGVGVEIGILPGYAEAERIEAVDAKLRKFLHPLKGFEGEGWPFGRPVYESEIYEAVESVDGIDCVLDVDLTASGPGARYREGSVEIGRSSLVYSEDHDVVIQTGRDGCGVGS